MINTKHYSINTEKNSNTTIGNEHVGLIVLYIRNASAGFRL